MRPASRDLCHLCKGTQNLCGLGYCPLLAKLRVQKKLPEMRIKKEVFGPTPPGFFVGGHGYPEVYWGPTVSLNNEEAWKMDSPDKWYGLPFDKIVELRSSLVRSATRSRVNDFSSRYLDRAQDAILSVKTVDVEMKFKRELRAQLVFSSDVQPMGPSAPLDSFKVVDNPKVPWRVDQLVGERVKAVDAVKELWGSGESNYYLTKLLSAGVLGRNEHRKMVPTRWSLTAVMDMVAKHLMEKIRYYPEIGEYRIYSSEYLHNHYEILLMPGMWEYEDFEAWAPGSIWAGGSHDFRIVEEHEPFQGRTRYADKERGGYYAARLGICEGLDVIRRQARAIVFREIYEGYVVPVGVWQVLEGARHAMRGKPKKFSSRQEALDYLKTRLRIPIPNYFKESRILRQRRLTEF